MQLHSPGNRGKIMPKYTEYKHLLDDGKTIYAVGNTYDVYSGKNIFGDPYTQVSQRGGYSAPSGGYSGGYDAYTSLPQGTFYHGPVSVPKENVSLLTELMAFLLLPCLSVLTGDLTREGGLIIFSVFLMTRSGVVLHGLRALLRTCFLPWALPSYWGNS